jgi:hypothetical protein
VCPKCRRKEVRRVTIPYQCERLHNGRPITVALASLCVPRCHHCGELVFDYQAEEQVNRAYQAQKRALGNSSGAEHATSQPA